jgi:hypothetical protein
MQWENNMGRLEDSIRGFSEQYARSREEYDQEIQDGLAHGSFATWFPSGAPAFAMALKDVESRVQTIYAIGGVVFGNFEELLSNNGVDRGVIYTEDDKKY